MSTKIILLLFIFLTVGCSPTPIKPPVSDITQIPKLELVELNAVVVPSKPHAIAIQKDGTTYAAYTSDGLDDLKKVFIAANANTKALAEGVDAHNALIRERNSIAEMVTLEQQKANILAQQFAQAENQRRYEEWAHNNRSMFYEFIILLLTIGIVTL
jgi:isopentenyl diphosphate isomerase/L-lactate dehydrogenase-like FMN-dependent dehydrogenase